MPIDPEKYYAATVVVHNGWFPWVKSAMTIMSMMKEKKAQELYKPVIRKVGKVTRYYIKGSTVVDIIRAADEGRLKI